MTSACGRLAGVDIDRIAAVLKDWRLSSTGVKSWMYSQVTAGGVDVSEVNPRTMESKLAGGVYFAGEVLDVDGDCGGYNLQWAWSSGYVAGTNAAG
jgi:predicted flavoprotein YhiN